MFLRASAIHSFRPAKNQFPGNTPVADCLAFEFNDKFIATGGGLYRYPLGDRIRVTGFVQETRCFRFVGRDEYVSDHFGEKLSAAFVEKVVSQAVAALNLKASFLLLAPTATDQGTGYALFIAAKSIPDPPALMRLVQAGLAENFHYQKCREPGQLSALRLYHVDGGGISPAAVFHEVLRSRGTKLGAIKPSLLDRHLGWEMRLNGRFID